MTPEQENIQLRQQLLQLHIRCYNAEQNAIYSGVVAAKCLTTVEELKSKLPELVRKQSENDRNIIHKLTQDATQVVELLGAKTHEYLRGAINE